MQETNDWLHYPLTYTDALGQETTTCLSNGQQFVLTLRGVCLRGHSLNFLKPDNPQSAIHLFPLDTNLYMHSDECLYELHIPLRVRSLKGFEQATLSATFDYRKAFGGTGNDLWGTLKLPGMAVQSTQKVTMMEYLLIDLQKQLPHDYTILCCLSCRNSYYSPFGCNDIGDIFCFKNYADKLHAVTDKSKLLELWEEAETAQQLWQMQETYCCNQFTHLKGNEWVYKDWIYGVASRA